MLYLEIGENNENVQEIAKIIKKTLHVYQTQINQGNRLIGLHLLN